MVCPPCGVGQLPLWAQQKAPAFLGTTPNLCSPPLSTALPEMPSSRGVPVHLPGLRRHPEELTGPSPCLALQEEEGERGPQSSSAAGAGKK